MAAKKTQPSSNRIPDALTKTKVSFKASLSERVLLGKELIDKSITNFDELKELEKDYYKWDKYNSELLKNSFNNEDSEYVRSYNYVNYSPIFGGAASNGQEKLKELKEDITNKVENLESLVDRVDLIKSEIEHYEKPPSISSQTMPSKSIFIVHGHNSHIKEAVARTLQLLGLEPIILHEQANAGRTIIEKFETYSNVGFAIVLLTDDDEGKSRTELDLKKRARQNVVLELGYFLGKLGRANVLPLYSSGVEKPSDVDGLVYVEIDPNGVWRFSLVQELKAAGYEVDANKVMI